MPADELPHGSRTTTILAAELPHGKMGRELLTPTTEVGLRMAPVHEHLPGSRVVERLPRIAMVTDREPLQPMPMIVGLGRRPQAMVFLRPLPEPAAPTLGGIHLERVDHLTHLTPLPQVRC